MDEMISSEPEAAVTDEPAPVPSPGPAPLDSRFGVPITIELESTIIPLAKLQGLQEGSVLPLDASAGAIPVRILASGRPFARGSLVSVGDGYGVLIEAE
jgi:flagellar motor switch protein FliN/FliY